METALHSTSLSSIINTVPTVLDGANRSSSRFNS
jgi:hypothetical protein